MPVMIVKLLNRCTASDEFGLPEIFSCGKVSCVRKFRSVPKAGKYIKRLCCHNGRGYILPFLYPRFLVQRLINLILSITTFLLFIVVFSLILVLYSVSHSGIYTEVASAIDILLLLRQEADL
jgi:hypothetical protein